MNLILQTRNPKYYTFMLCKKNILDWIMVVENRWNKCISLKGDYVEK